MIEHWTDKRYYYDLQIEPVTYAETRSELLMHAMREQALTHVDHVRWIKPLRALLGEHAYKHLLYTGYQTGYIIPEFTTIDGFEDDNDKLYLFHAAANFGSEDTTAEAKREWPFKQMPEWGLRLDMERQVLPFLLLTRLYRADDVDYITIGGRSFLGLETQNSPDTDTGEYSYEYPNLVMHAYRLGSTPKDWHFEALRASDSKAWALMMAYRRGLTPIDRHFDLFGKYDADDGHYLKGRLVTVDDMPMGRSIVDCSKTHYGLPIALMHAWDQGLEPRWSHLQCFDSDVIRLPMVTKAIEAGFLKLSREGITRHEGDCPESNIYLRRLAVRVIEDAYERWIYRPGGARASDGAARFDALAAAENH